MDPVLMTLAGKALQIVAPYLAKGGEKVAEALGEQIGTQVKGLVERITARFRREPAQAQVLDAYAANPAANEGAVQNALARELEADPAFRAEVEQDVNRFGSVLSVVQRIKEGKEVTGAEIDEVSEGLIQVHQEIEKGEKIVGFKGGSFGATKSAK